MTEFQESACAIGLVQMLRKKHFDICTLDALAKTMGRTEHMAGPDYSALRLVHCVDWADMGPDAVRMVHEKCFELLGMPPQVIDVVVETKKEPPQQTASKLKLAFWK